MTLHRTCTLFACASAAITCQPAMARTAGELVTPRLVSQRSRAVMIDAGTGGLRLEARRQKVRVAGQETEPQLASSEYGVSASAWHDLAPDVTLHLDAHARRARSHALAGPFLGSPSAAMVQEYRASLDLAQGWQLAGEYFDRDGWALDDVAEMARRMSNGESQRERGGGVALAWEGQARRTGSATTIPLRLGLAVQRRSGGVTAPVAGRMVNSDTVTVKLGLDASF